MAAYALKTRALVSVPFCIFAAVHAALCLQVYTRVLWGRLRDRHSGKAPTSARCPLPILVPQ